MLIRRVILITADFFWIRRHPCPSRACHAGTHGSAGGRMRRCDGRRYGDGRDKQKDADRIWRHSALRARTWQRRRLGDTTRSLASMEKTSRLKGCQRAGCSLCRGADFHRRARRCSARHGALHTKQNKRSSGDRGVWFNRCI